MAERSRRPQRSPRQTGVLLEQAVLALRRSHPGLGRAQIEAALQDLGSAAPAASTITEILRRRHLLGQPGAEPGAPWQHFERPELDDLWQMDFKGHVPCRDGWCHPPDGGG